MICNSSMHSVSPVQRLAVQRADRDAMKYRTWRAGAQRSASAATAQLDGGSEIAWLETGLLGDSRQHSRPDFLAVVESEGDVWPAVALQHSM